MISLNGRKGAVFMDPFGQLKQPRHELLAVDAQLLCSVCRQRIVDTGVFYSNERRAAAGAQAVIVFHFFRNFTGKGGIVRPHRRHDDAVTESRALYREGLENMRELRGHEKVLLAGRTRNTSEKQN